MPTWHTGSTTCPLTSLRPCSAALTQCSMTPPATHWQSQHMCCTIWGTGVECSVLNSWISSYTVFEQLLFLLKIQTDFLLILSRSSSLWVYVFDDSDDQIPPTYLAKTPIPLRALAAGRDIRGETGNNKYSSSMLLNYSTSSRECDNRQ